MLFGGKAVEGAFLTDVFQIAEAKGFHVLFIAMVGSISNGYPCLESDYDTRVLYVKEDFPARCPSPAECKEAELIYRFYPDNPRNYYEWIPFWEASSFFQYLVEPKLDGKFSYGLYNVVPWTILSPYTWDPFGIANRIAPLMQTIFDPKLAMGKFMEWLDESPIPIGPKAGIRAYLDLLRYVLSAQWIWRYRQFAPVSLDTLLAACNNLEIRRIGYALLEELKSWNEAHANDKALPEHISHTVQTAAIPQLNAYLSQQVETLKAAFESLPHQVEEMRAPRMQTVNAIFQILESAHRQPFMQRVGAVKKGGCEIGL